tara:strand:+ start:1527 stop:1739 length:213 start_codon:yes stop_codon:yes gene_type:complete
MCGVSMAQCGSAWQDWDWCHPTPCQPVSSASAKMMFGGFGGVVAIAVAVVAVTIKWKSMAGMDENCEHDI